MHGHLRLLCAQRCVQKLRSFKAAESKRVNVLLCNVPEEDPEESTIEPPLPLYMAFLPWALLQHGAKIGKVACRNKDCFEA